MGKRYRRPLSRYVLALITIAPVLLLIRFLSPSGQAHTRPLAVVVLCLAAVVFISWRGGFGPGLLGTVLLTLVLAFFRQLPAQSVVIRLPGGMPLALFVAIAFLVSLLSGLHRHQVDHLRRNVRRKDEILAILAHELRTPLTATTIALSFLRRAERNGETEEARGVLERQVAHMTRLIDNVMEMARLAHGKAQLCKELVDLAALVTQAIDATAPLVEVLRHRLEVALPPDPLPLLVDRFRIVQILVNLLTNAARYTKPGGLIRLEAERCQDRIWLRVSDSGIGLAPESISHVFELFNQEENGSQGGLGIGLSVVRQLAELHGGGVMAHSDGLGQGSEFAVWLPLGASNTPREVAPAERFSNSARQLFQALWANPSMDGGE
jgi:signal transduction histidine kinase